MDEKTDEQKKPSGGGCLKFGLIGCGVLFVVVVASGIYLALNWESLSVSIGHSFAVAVVEKSQLSEEDKKEIIAEIDSLKAKYDSEEITGEDIIKVFAELAESPIMGLGIVLFAEEQYIKPSGLSEEEKTAARLTVNRFARGLAEKKISKDDLEETKDTVFGDGHFKETLTDDELRTFLDDMKKAADAADIPNEDYVVDVAEEFRKAVRAALGD